MITETVVTAKCVGCGHKREIRAGEIPKGEMPMCPKCFMPMLADKAIRRRKKK
jgi:hypothetical protein